jgi:predicted DNA-binding transcriptional regulator AlpA
MIQIDIKKEVNEAIKPLLEEIKELKEKLENNNTRLLPLAEVAKMLKKNPRTIIRWEENGEFPPSIKYGKERYWELNSILNFKKNQERVK